MARFFLQTCIILHLSLLSFSQTTTDDSTATDSESDFFEFSRNLDSMLNLWYVQNSVRNNGSYEYADSLADTLLYPRLKNEEYVNRLQMMNTYIEMTFNDIVLKFIEFYSIKRRKQVEVMLGLSEYYFPIFEEALDRYGLPLELKYLPVIESALNPNAISRAGASGLWQFMYPTGKLYKLNVNTYVDERQDPVKSSDAAAHYLSDLYQIYRDWHLVIAAYNCGPGNINKAIKRTGKTTYWGIYDRLPRETKGYVPAFIAAAYAMHYYKDYKMNPVKIDLPVATDTIIISDELHLAQAAEVLQIPFEKIRTLNPQYKKYIIPANYEPYPLVLPSENITQFLDMKDSIFNYRDSLYFASIRPSQYNSASGNRNNAGTTDGVRIIYTIRSGDSFSSIAKKFHVSINDIKIWNHIPKNRLIAGKKLDIYVSGDKAHKYKQHSTQSSTGISANKSTDVTTDKDGKWLYYKVKSGDNFWTIAKNYPGVSAENIMEWNNVTNSRKLQIGQTLRIKTN